MQAIRVVSMSRPPQQWSVYNTDKTFKIGFGEVITMRDRLPAAQDPAVSQLCADLVNLNGNIYKYSRK